HRRDALGRGEEGSARCASGDRGEAAVGALRRRTGDRRGTGAREPEPRLRREVRLPLRRLRQPPAEVGARARPPRAARTQQGGGARDGARRARRDRRGQMAQLLALGDYWWGWGNLLFRWLHVVAAIDWIGSAFYFIAL